MPTFSRKILFIFFIHSPPPYSIILVFMKYSSSAYYVQGSLKNTRNIAINNKVFLLTIMKLNVWSSSTLKIWVSVRSMINYESTQCPESTWQSLSTHFWLPTQKTIPHDITWATNNLHQEILYIIYNMVYLYLIYVFSTFIYIYIYIPV